MTIKTLHITNAYHPASGGIRTFYNALLAAANRHRRSSGLSFQDRRPRLKKLESLAAYITLRRRARLCSIPVTA
jgi:hypothetical protein